MKSGYCTIMWNGRDRGSRKVNTHQPYTKDQSSSKEVDIVYMVGLKGSPDYELLPENQTINSKKYCSQLDQLKAALNEKHPELVNRKGIVFHQDNSRPHVSLMTRQKLLQLGWEVLIHLL